MSDDDPVWGGAQKVEQWVGEIRVNLIRLVAILAFYAHHLFTFYVLKDQVAPGVHAVMTGIAFAWAALALCLHAGLSRRWNPVGLKFGAIAGDAVMMTALLLVFGGPKSPFVALYFLLIASAALRLDLAAVWTATIAAVAGYALLCGHAKWIVLDASRAPRTHQVIFGIALLCAGLIAGQLVRQARRLAVDYAERVRA